MTSKRTRYSAKFKVKVAVEALRGELTTVRLATKWRAVEEMAAGFSGRTAAQETKSKEAEVEKLHARIGQLLVEQDLPDERLRGS